MGTEQELRELAALPELSIFEWKAQSFGDWWGGGGVPLLGVKERVSVHPGMQGSSIHATRALKP